MAGRVAKSAVNWAQFAQRVRPENMGYYRAFKQINDKYTARVQQLPEDLPKIDFEYYKKNVDDPAWVEKMQAAYEKMTVAYPKDPDNLTEKISKDAADAEETKKVKIADLQASVASHQAMIKAIDTLPPWDEMTEQMLRFYFPERCPNPNEPTFWPHSPLDDIEYVTGTLNLRHLNKKYDYPQIMRYRIYQEK